MNNKQRLNAIAHGIISGTIFTDRHVRDKEMLPMVFIPLALMDEKGRELFLAEKPDLVYEELHKAAPSSINGYPIFFSLKFLNTAETTVVLRMVRRSIFWTRVSTDGFFKTVAHYIRRHK